MFAYDADVDAGADAGAWHGQTSLNVALPWAHYHERQYSHSPMGTAIENCCPDADAVGECDVVNVLAFDWPDAYPPVSMVRHR